MILVNLAASEMHFLGLDGAGGLQEDVELALGVQGLGLLRAPDAHAVDEDPGYLE